MKKAKLLFFFILSLLMLTSTTAWAEDATWQHKWDKSRADGGEGFYNISNHDLFTQVATLNTLEWTYQGNSYTTAFTGSKGQYFGTAANPVIHATLTTDKLKGKIKSVKVEAKTNVETQVATIGVSVNSKDYKSPASLTTTQTEYEFLPDGDAEEGTIVITMDQNEDTPGIIYFYSMTIVYEGEGVVVEKKDPGLAYSVQEMKVEAGDNAYANYLTNPYNVSPITYSIDDESIAVLNSKGDIFTTGKVGTTTVKASFAGDDKYLPGEASYTLIVEAKPVIPVPTVDIPGGTYTEAQTITIESNDPLCKAIWYSTTLTDPDDMGYDERTIIVPGNKAVVTLDETCTLYCCAVGDNNMGLILKEEYVFNIPLQASFTSNEASSVYYQMGWDSIEEASAWKYYGINESTWTLASSPELDGCAPFSSIDPTSTYSLTIFYANSQQRERAESPEIEVKPNSSVEFYAGFGGVWLVYADCKLKVKDITAGTEDVLFSAFNWAQENDFTGPNWLKFNFDLSKYAGHTCQFEFIYEGAGGDNFAIDAFKLCEQNDDANQIIIMEGESVHFKDTSAGSPTEWAWTFDGGNPSSSTEQNPVVKYETAGEYKVALTVKKGSESSSTSVDNYIVVKVAAPKARIGLPEGGYLSPWSAAYVPLNTPVTFTDASTGNPTSWKWTFEGTDIASSTEQNPTVTYKEEGLYGLDLTVTNAAGSDRDFLVKAIKAGGSQDVWNITPEESANVGEIALGWYGCYGGTNWLGMKSFAEHFDKPAVPATIDKVSIYFEKTTASDGNQPITVSICKADPTGMPGEEIASASLNVSELKYDATELVATDFTFDEAVSVDGEFFIVVTGFPEDYSDHVCMSCLRRNPGEKTTTYHLLEDEDANYQPLGTYTWYKNTDDPASFALTAHMTYGDASTGIKAVSTTGDAAIYSINGTKVADKDINGTSLARGIYITRSNGKSRKVVVK